MLDDQSRIEGAIALGMPIPVRVPLANGCEATILPSGTVVTQSPLSGEESATVRRLRERLAQQDAAIQALTAELQGEQGGLATQLTLISSERDALMAQLTAYEAWADEVLEQHAALTAERNELLTRLEEATRSPGLN